MRRALVPREALVGLRDLAGRGRHAQGGAVGVLDAQAAIDFEHIAQRLPLNLKAGQVAVVRLGQAGRRFKRVEEYVGVGLVDASRSARAAAACAIDEPPSRLVASR